MNCDGCGRPLDADAAIVHVTIDDGVARGGGHYCEACSTGPDRVLLRFPRFPEPGRFDGGDVCGACGALLWWMPNPTTDPDAPAALSFCGNVECSRHLVGRPPVAPPLRADGRVDHEAVAAAIAVKCGRKLADHADAAATVTADDLLPFVVIALLAVLAIAVAL